MAGTATRIATVGGRRATPAPDAHVHARDAPAIPRRARCRRVPGASSSTGASPTMSIGKVPRTFAQNPAGGQQMSPTFAGDVYVADGAVMFFSPASGSCMRRRGTPPAREALHMKCLDLCVFVSWPRAHRSACVRSLSTRCAAVAMDDAPHWCLVPADFFAEVLTVEKTVIRFRGNRRLPQKRVSRTQYNRRSTTRTSASGITRWDRASSPPGKFQVVRSDIRADRPVRMFLYPREGAGRPATRPTNPIRCAVRVGGCRWVRYPLAA